MMTMRWICCVLGIAVILPGSGVAEEAVLFRFSRPINVVGQAQEEWFSVLLDSDVYAATRDSFPDLRVLDAGDRLVPFLIRRVSEPRTEQVRKIWTAVNPTLMPLDNNGMEIRIILKPEDPSPLALNFVTPLQNFEQQVRVFSTAEGTESMLVDGVLIFDYSQFMDVRRTEVVLPPTSAREFRIVIDALTSDQESQLLELTRSLRGDAEDIRTEKTTIQRRPFRIDRIDLWTEQADKIVHADKVQPWPVTDLKVTQDSEENQTLVEFVSRREPLTELTIVTGSRNFSRHAVLQIFDDKSANHADLKTIADTTISQFQLRDFQEEHLTIRLPETRRDSLRLVLDNGDSPALSIDAVNAFGHQDEVVFLGKPDQNVRLVYGSETAQPPNSDTVALMTALARGIQPVTATLGVQSAIAGSGAQKPVDVKSLLNNPFLMGSVIGILVILLGWGLYQASRRIDQMPHGDAE